MSNLDLVITVDTAVAHLAGALNRPGWVMLPFSPDWRWLTDRADSPWYPSLRLYRQPTPGDWGDVVARVRADLTALVAERTGSVAATERMEANDALSLGTVTVAVDRRDLRRQTEALARAANEHHQAKRHAECETELRRLLALDRDNASAMHVLALTRFYLHDRDESIDWLGKAVALEPNNGRMQRDLGILLHEAGRFDAALAATQRALALNPHDASTYNGLGAALSSLERPVDAIDAYRRALAIKPDYFECWANIAHAQQLLGAPDDAAASYRRALGIKVDYAEAQCGLGLLALSRGDYAIGFTKLEWRWRLPRMTPRHAEWPAWQGEPLNGRTILLHAEQGAGDTIQCLRFVPEVAARGGRIVLELPPSLTRLATSLAGGGEIVPTGGTLPAYDVQCALMSLPRVLGTRLETLPAAVPYLHPDAALAEQWSRRLVGPGLKVGVAWAGNPEHSADRRRSIDVERLAPLFDVANVRFHSLQVGRRGDDAERPLHRTVVDLAPDLTNFAETAAVIANLDLVLTVDTAVAHLAGALGRPCWVMLPFAPDWRWLSGRDDSPWYPTLRLFRQPAPGDWDSVIANVRAALGGHPGNGAAKY